ncbi:MAG: peptidoglycan bridge formation glycyltransferase FemA/FemB family protein [Chloroflexi bacterium]|nr:MAG: peptidoglycan bridge formation glycyltransferase FemA/FemB family protein [Chloroflexota bacterium]
MTEGIRPARPDELDDWDGRTVDVPGGNVYQSVAWGRYRERHGWRPRFLVFEDGFRLLSLERPWPLVGGAGAYLSRGPIPAEGLERTAARLRAAADHLAADGVDVVASDPEIEASTGYAALIEADGFAQIEEIQPSRHRMRLALPSDTDEEALFRSFGSTLRQLIHAAEKAGLRVVRYDARSGAGPEPTVGPGFEAPPPGSLEPAAAAPVFERLYDLLEAAAVRRHFHIASKAAFVDWSVHGLAAGHVVYLEVRDTDDEPVGGATFYRHGGRLTYSHSADRVELRRQYPGVVRLILWRAIQLAIRDRLDELDLAGVDVAGARREPREGEEMHGLYAFKRSFGAEWVELAGNHEWVARPWRYAAGRVTARLAAIVPRSRSEA